MRWQPTAKLANLRARADLLAHVRGFMAERNILEVQTPVLTEHGVSDLHIDSVAWTDPHSSPSSGFLRSSPEYAHKRLLAAGYGDVYELGPVFRAGEHGRQHRTEFTLLEWYRLGWTWRPLAEEVIALIETSTQRPWSLRWVEWAEALHSALAIDALTISDGQLLKLTPSLPSDCDRWARLDYLWSTRVQSQWPANVLTVVHHYPAEQAALAELDPDRPSHALRFEVFAGAIELANGYQELTDAQQQQQRFDADADQRRRRDKPSMHGDPRLLAAMAAGLPACAGVALGVDRLLMVKLDSQDIAEVIAFAER